MNKKTLDKIYKFKGDIRSSFNFLMEVYGDLEFQLQTNLQAISSPYDTFGNAIRSYRQKGLLGPTDKHGAKLILSGTNLIRYLLVQRFLLVGVKLSDLKVSIPDMTDENLKYLIISESLSLSDLPIITFTKPDKLTTSTANKLTSDLPVSYTLKISPGVQLLINANQYSVDEAIQIVKVIKTALAGSDC